MKTITLLAIAGMVSVSTLRADPNIVEAAKSTGMHKTLVAAVVAAGKVELLSGPGPFTVFAPTDEAFAALPAGTLDDLLKAENKEKLGKILSYHVVSGKVMSADVKTGEVPTAAGAKLNAKVSGGSVMINDAKVIKADVAVSNGVIHVIDKVLLPPSN
jgi:uncharacterized surface protein with fasciclin (FAS1) repeats